MQLVQRVAADEEDERGTLGVNVAQRPFADPVADDVGHHGDVLLHEPLVQLVEERCEDDLVVAAEDRVDERVLAVERNARLREAAEALDGGPGPGKRLARALEPCVVELADDGAEHLFLAFEVAVDRAGGDAGLARDLGDAGPPVAERREAAVGSSQNAVARDRSRFGDRAAWHSERLIQPFTSCQSPS